MSDAVKDCIFTSETQAVSLAVAIIVCLMMFIAELKCQKMLKSQHKLSVKNVCFSSMEFLMEDCIVFAVVTILSTQCLAVCINMNWSSLELDRWHPQ